MDAADFDAVGELFADGVLLDPERHEIAKGREGVAEFYKRMVILHDGSPRTKHVTRDAVIDVDEGTATSHSSYEVHQDDVLVAAGRYEDRFRRSDRKWRFTERRFYLDEAGDVSQHLRVPQSETT